MQSCPSRLCVLLIDVDLGEVQESEDESEVVPCDSPMQGGGSVVILLIDIHGGVGEVGMVAAQR